MKNYKILLLITLFFLLLPLTFIFSAELEIDLGKKEVKVGEEFRIEIHIDTGQEIINAIKGGIEFSNESCELVSIRDGNSILDFWIKSPKKEGNIVLFSGIIPGGYRGRGKIFEMVFHAKKREKCLINIEENEIYLNDGKGTKVDLSEKKYEMLIFKGETEKEDIIEDDTLPPEDFSPEIISDPNLFNNKKVIIFSTQDKQSGIDHYEIKEKERDFVIAQSPYLLKEQSLKDKIVIKAVDRAGNERKVEIFYPKEEKNIYFYLIITLLMGLISYLVWKKYVQRI